MIKKTSGQMNKTHLILAIQALLQNKTVGTQEEIREALQKQGISANQVKISRVLHKIGAIKMSEGDRIVYRLPTELVSMTPKDPLKQLVLNIKHNESLIIIQTAPGLALGGLIASLFMGNGLGLGMLSWLVVALILFALINIIRSLKNNRAHMSTQSIYYQDQFKGNDTHTSTYQPMINNDFTRVSRSAKYPAGFDSAGFLRDAKVLFMRLQAANDERNLSDIRIFTTPEVFAEIQLQLQESGDEKNKTEIINLSAELLDVTAEFQDTIASVQFSGTLREAPNDNAAPFDEIWHFRKVKSSSQWIVAGIQQDEE